MFFVDYTLHGNVLSVSNTFRLQRYGFFLIYANSSSGFLCFFSKFRSKNLHMSFFLCNFAAF